ncbi:MAG: DnaA regulatory inactivator Hda [Gammaproteobacteria bacterium CG22_combo_CG10-13_8_21_14_all_40_8]|nr:MAG: DnaA regulatory inactivator Hda [Gammaproteobacteria bacterium CG22_combo_CG10-13_8_21_14_all_40_8]
MVKKTQQLTLPISSSELPSFENFVIGDNLEAVLALKQLSEKSNTSSKAQLIYVHGQQGCGVSHLLQATVDFACQQGINALYFDLSEKALSPKMLQGLESYELVCLDDVAAVVGGSIMFEREAEWEEALFHLFNHLKDAGHQLVVGSSQLPQNLHVRLPDLVSRWDSMVRFHIMDISDQDKEQALIQRAKFAGLNLAPEVAKYLISRGSRNLNQLIANLDKLDQASLASKRAITIPLVKEVLGF